MGIQHAGGHLGSGHLGTVLPSILVCNSAANTMIKANCVLERSGLVIRCICIPCTSEKNRGRYRSDLAAYLAIFLRMLSRRLWMQHMILPNVVIYLPSPIHLSYPLEVKW
ncbi:hypothetical protein LSTR_LSTR006337 [Laodelphax striatellus]|uniref:Uncharacterized protein n=1 Tax=Laodelphax striatellus TaxID=195883 RepID=A0A482XDC5_LAOST|nr:hypothetical protein LSTR_LSTR006337 [Laodelphax striatellus]